MRNRANLYIVVVDWQIFLTVTLALHMSGHLSLNAALVGPYTVRIVLKDSI
jgi:hypothetical protein